MDLYILDSEFNPVAIVDNYISIIWVTRYYTCGDFELYISADDSLFNFLKPDYFIARDDDSSIMVIEKLEIKTDIEKGNFFIVSGRSLESVLARRVITTQTIINTTNPISGIKSLIESCTNSTRRAIPGLVIDASLSINEELTVQFTGGTLLDAITSICTRFSVGSKMTLSGKNIRLSFYQGDEVDVIFSAEFDNLINSDYIFDYTNYANFAHVAGEGEGKNRRGIGVTKKREAGLAHREIYVDARDISSNDGDVSDDDYVKMLQERGMEKLEKEHSITKSFEAEVNPSGTYKYKIDYNLGDIITITNEYGISAHPRIVEIIENWDKTGYKVVPTFEEMEPET